MTRDELIKEIFKLSIADREFLVHEIWASIGCDMGYEEVSDEDTNPITSVKEPKAEYGTAVSNLLYLSPILFA